MEENKPKKKKSLHQLHYFSSASSENNHRIPLQQLELGSKKASKELAEVRVQERETLTQQVEAKTVSDPAGVALSSER